MFRKKGPVFEGVMVDVPNWMVKLVEAMGLMEPQAVLSWQG